MEGLKVFRITGILSLENVIAPKEVINIIGKEQSISPEQVVMMDRNILLSRTSQKSIVSSTLKTALR